MKFIHIIAIISCFAAILSTGAESKKIEAGNIIKKYDLSKSNYAGWKKSGDKELTLRRAKEENGENTLVLNFDINHKKNSPGEKYVKAWPRIYYQCKKREMNLNEYDYVAFKVIISSSRKNPLKTLMSVTVRSYEGATAHLLFDLGKDNKSWRQIVVPVKDILKNSKSKPDKFKAIKRLQFVISESKYTDKTQLQLKIKDIALIKTK